LYGLALLKSNRSTEAITQLQACIDKADAPTLAPGCPGVNQAAPHHLIADCLTRDGRAEEAEEHYCQAVLKEPGNPGPRHDYARFLAAHNRAPEAIELLHEFLGKGTPNEHLWALGCNIVNTHLADSQIAEEWTETAALHYPENEDIIKHRAIALLTAGKFEGALELFEKEPSSDDITTAAIYLCRLANGKADKLSMPENEIAVSKYLTDWYRRLLVHENETAADQVASRIDDMESVLPTAGKVLRQAVAA
jgi:tetratricopeptide (TPR) repeat protein